jgi:hypothetical protein
VTPALFHVSHDGPFTTLVPRPSPAGTPHVGRLLVWAVDEDHLPNYLLPRDCPRVCWRGDGVHVVGVEQAWADRLDEAPLNVHRLAPATFAPLGPIGADGGYWVSSTTTAVIDVEVVTDVRAALTARDVELRVVVDLWPLVDEVTASDRDFSCIRMRHAHPRPATG